jgi:ABC-type Fe3+-hydroxamate transport system substrate-binding protein
MNTTSATAQESGQWWAKIKKYGKHVEYVEELEAKIAYHQNQVIETEKEIERVSSKRTGKQPGEKPHF